MKKFLQIFITFLCGVIIGMGIIGLVFIKFYVPNQEIASKKWKASIQKEEKNKIVNVKNQAQIDAVINEAQNKGNDSAEIIRDSLKNFHLIGGIYAVKNGKVILDEGMGYSRRKPDVHNSPTTLFPIGSIQKSVTGALAVKVFSEYGVSLMTTLNQYYPSIAGSDQITLENLLTMSSGLFFGSARPTQFLDDNALIEFIAQNIKLNNPGVYKYSPVNFVLLAGILEKVTRTPYQNLCQKYIVDKLNLKNTLFYNEAINTGSQTIGYKKTNGLDYGVRDTFSHLQYNYELGTGNLFMSSENLFRFEQSIVDNTLLTSNEYETMSHPENKAKYFGGIYQREKYIFSHGIEGGNECVFVMSKDGKTGLVIYSNQKPQGGMVKFAQKLFELL